VGSCATEALLLPRPRRAKETAPGWLAHTFERTRAFNPRSHVVKQVRLGRDASRGALATRRHSCIFQRARIIKPVPVAHPRTPACRPQGVPHVTGSAARPVMGLQPMDAGEMISRG